LLPFSFAYARSICAAAGTLGPPTEGPLIYGTTFHAQPCAEKYRKAILVSRRHTFPRTHDLIALHDLCLGNDIRVPIDPDKLERFTAYAVQVRYPGEEPTLDEAREALQMRTTTSLCSPTAHFGRFGLLVRQG